MPVGAAMTERTTGRSLQALLPERAGVPSDLWITGIAYDSRRVREGNLFFALPGLVTDGAKFVSEAVANGAAAIVAHQTIECPVPVIVVDNPRRSMAEVTHHFFGHPDRAVAVIGIVGTNGKSTVAAGLQSVWSDAGWNAGSIGTVGHGWAKQRIDASRTTPEAPDLDKILASMRDDGVSHAAVEVSSHAIALDRVWDMNFAGGVFTNITRDHLDFHKTFDQYKSVKRTFFDRLPSKAFAAINADDPAADEFVEAASSASIVRYSTKQSDTDVTFTVTSHSIGQSHGTLTVDGEDFELTSPLWGAFNHANLAAIAAGAYASGLSASAICDGLVKFTGVPGRLEIVPTGSPFDICIDFAHTPDALNSVLSTVKRMVKRQLLVVFGCGGDRDRGKRPLMARAVEQWADRIYLTSDNPRSEDPNAIIANVLEGFRPDTSVWSDSDRAVTIQRAVGDAQAGDLVLLCGKGHETTQEIAGTMHRFSDRDEAVKALAAVGHRPPAP